MKLIGLELAQAIWNEEVDKRTLIQMLEGENVELRRTAAWAIADAASPRAGLEWLLANGASHPDEEVRRSTQRCWKSVLNSRVSIFSSES